jgi:23S rRNA (uracil1939-C5)-methyltransferase
MTQAAETLILEITDLSRAGSGVARDETGRVIFVPFTAPGDQVKVQIIESEKRYATGQLLEIIRPSKIRQTPRCPAFTRCGGCQWQHLPYEVQWKTKSSGVRHALTRVGLEPETELEEIPAERIWEYRNRIQLRGEHVRENQGAEKTILGFYARNSHDVIPLDRCDIARPEINHEWEATRKQSRELTRPFKVELEVNELGIVSRSWNKGHAAQGFRQVHDEQNEKLREWVCFALTPGQPLLDLFGGSGNLSFQFAPTAPEIHCVDVSVPQPKPPRYPSHFHFHRAPVADWVKRNKLEKKAWSAIIDPPRLGLGKEFIIIAEGLEKAGVKELVAVGCDPDTWARDVSRFVKRGWKLKRFAALDLFPQTSHVESLALLTK